MDDKEGKDESGSGGEGQTVTTYPSTKELLPAMAAIYMAVFLVAVERTIIGTAIPSITKEFNSFGDVAWYEAGFLLPLCALQLSFGRVYKHYSAKWLLVALIAVFEVGSIVSAAAPTSNALIVGRVIQGFGATGITSGAFMLLTILVPLQSRPKWAGGLGAMFGIASIAGPIAGGYLTSITWRWCQYLLIPGGLFKIDSEVGVWINLPFGGVSLILLLLSPNRPPPVKPAETVLGKILQLDPLGFTLVAPSIISLVFALQWGGTKYPWGDARIIALFVVFGSLGAAFIASQIWRKEEATIPPKILMQRSILWGSIAQLGIGSLLVLYAFYLPIWFQVIKGKSPQDSGLCLVALLLSNVLAVIVGGILTSGLGYYTSIMWAGSVVLIVGAALITTWSANVGPGKWISYQVVAGLGLGAVLQQPNIAVQTVLPDRDISIGIALLNFIGFLGGSVFVTVAQTLLQNRLQQGLKGLIPNFDPSEVTNAGAASLRSMVSPAKLPAVLKVYNDSMRSIWYLGLGLACLVFVGSLGMEWKSVKKEKKEEPPAEAVATGGIP